MKKILLIVLIGIVSTHIYAQGFPICDVAGDQTRPDVVFDGTEYAVVYDSVGDIWGAKVSTDGTVRLRFPIEIDPAYNDRLPAVAFDGSTFCVIWNKVGAPWYVQGAIIQGTTVVRRFDVLTTTNPYFCRPAIAFNGTYYLIVTHIITLGDGVLYGIFYETDGDLAYPTFIIDDNDQNHFGDAMIASDGDKFIVVYPFVAANPPYLYEVRYALVEPPDIHQNFMLTDVSADNLVPSEFGLYPPSVAFNGKDYFCAYHFFEEDPAVTGILNLYGARIETDGSIISKDIPIAAEIGVNEYASAVTAEDKNFFITWQDDRTGDVNLYSRHFDRYGEIASAEITISDAADSQTVTKVAFDGINNLVVWQDYRNSMHWDIWGNLLIKSGFYADNPWALAYNGNRHLARKRNSEELHLVYMIGGKIIYRYSSNGGTDWTLPFIVGDGIFPAIALDVDGLPSITWTVSSRLYYRRQYAQDNWTDTYELYYTGGVGIVRSELSPPALAITHPPEVVISEDTIHILVSAARQYWPPINGYTWTNLYEVSFPITNPDQKEIRNIMADAGYLTLYPSVVLDFQRTLHASWVWNEVIYYALREIDELTWNNWGPQFEFDGLQSAHPFVETYGDSVFVVWQHKEATTQIEDVYRAARYLFEDYWWWFNVSQTPNTPSQMAVNATGRFTLFADYPAYPPPDNWFEIYCDDHYDGFYNVSQTPELWSFYPHPVARYGVIGTNLYTIWLEEIDDPMWEIRFRKSTFLPEPNPAYLTSPNGHETPSPYLIQRDSFISEWQIPVDVGYETISYQFPLEPGYRYRLKAIAYHESSGEWREWVIIDGKQKHLIKYNAFQPETLELWIPPAFYRDGMIEILIDRIKGDFAAVGPVYIYQFEYEEGEGGDGGPMALGNRPLNKSSFVAAPNPFTQVINIAFQTQGQDKINVKVYDITGRLVKNLYKGILENNRLINWFGEDENGRTVSPGVYFLKFTNADTKETFCHKIIKVE